MSESVTWPAWCCQSCGAHVGYLGRGVEGVTRLLGFTLHGCSRRRAHDWGPVQNIANTVDGILISHRQIRVCRACELPDDKAGARCHSRRWAPPPS